MMKTKNILIYGSVWEIIPKLTDSQLGEYFRAIANWRSGVEPTFTDFAVELLFSQYLPILEKQEKDYGQKLEASKKGVEVRKNKTNQSSTDNQTTTDRLPTDNQTTTERQPIEVEVEVEDEVDKEVEVDKQNDHLVSYKFIEPSSPEELELFSYLFAEFNENDNKFDEYFELWKKLSIQDQNNSVKYAANFIKYCNSKKKKYYLYYYIKETKWNWDTIKNMK